MVSTYTLGNLNNEGYINYPEESTVTELDLAFGYGAIIRQAEEQKGQHQPGEPYHIYPCLQRSQWMNMGNDEDWEAVLPSVELASRFLDDPAVTPFFAGLAGDNVIKLNDPIHEKTHNMTFDRWEYDNTVGEENDAATEDAMFAMMAFRKWIVLVFEKMSKFHGFTGWDEARQKMVISLNIDHLHMFRKDPGYGARAQSHPWSPGTDEETARLRTSFLLATLILHEFAHCAWQIRSLNKGETANPEPFLRDQPTNELGHEFENMIFSGLIRASGSRDRPVSAPYGLRIGRYPGPGLAELESEEQGLYPRGQARDWGRVWRTEYPVHMKFCQKMFSKDFWDGEVARYGLAACRPDRIKGIRGFFKKVVKVDPLAEGLSPRSLALHEMAVKRRNLKMVAVVKTDDIDRSDTEDEDEDGFVMIGMAKCMKALESAKEDQDGDVPMADAS